MNINKFTLVELLSVIAILGILISLLVPELAKARHKTINTVCMNNIRQQGIALLSYTTDNDQRYLSKVITPNQGNMYNGRLYGTNPFQRLTAETYALANYMGYNEYTSYSKNAAQAMACPYSFDEYYNRSPTWMKDTNGDGISELVPRFPMGFSWGTTSYQHYFSFYQYRWGVGRRPMIKVGDTIEYGSWADSASSNESRIIMSDASGAYKGQKNLWLSNHSITPGSNNSYGSDGDAMIKNNVYWRSYTQAGYVTTKHYSANYLFDDLSVKFRKNLNESNTATGVFVVTLPLEFFE